MKNSKYFKINLIYFISITAFVGVRIASVLGLFDAFDETIVSNVFTVTIQVGIMFLLPYILYINLFKRNPVKTLKDIGFKKINFNSILIAIAIGLLGFCLNLVVSTVFNGILGFFGYNPSSGGGGESIDTFVKFLTSLFFVAVLPGVFEEIMHRGFMMKTYIKEIGYKRALIYSSILFGLMHLNVGQVFYAIVMGALIGVTAIVSNSIFPAMIVHFMNNGINIYLVYAMTNDLFGAGFYDGINEFLQNNNPALTFVTAFLLLVVMTILLGYLIFRLYKENKGKDLENKLGKLEKALSHMDSNIFEDGNMVGLDFSGGGQELVIGDYKTTLSVLPKNMNLIKIDSPMDLILPETEQEKYKPSLLENIFFYGSVFMGALITLFTFVWGVL